MTFFDNMLFIPLLTIAVGFAGYILLFRHIKPHQVSSHERSPMKTRRRATGDFNTSFKKRSFAEEKCSRFFAEIWLLRRKKEILDDYTAEYVNTFHDAGWPEFNLALMNLSHAEELLANYLDTKNYEDASALASYLLNELSDHELSAARSRFQSMRGLEDWKAMTNRILNEVSISLESSAKDTKAAGIERSQRKRKPTLMMLSEMVDTFRKS